MNFVRTVQRRIPGRWASVALGFCIMLWVLPARPATAATLLGLVDTGELFVSADNGASWTVRSTLPVRDAVGLAAGASATELFLASRSGTVYRSIDAGVTWNAVGTVTASDVVDLAVQPDLSVLLITATGTLYQSVDLGASFTALATLTGPNFVSLDTAFGNVYALARSGEVWESVDDGASWTPVGAIAASNAVEMRAAGNQFVLTETGEVFKSVDLGRTWSAVGTLSQVHMSALTHDGKTLYAATREGEVATSPDAASWSWQGAMNQLSVIALSVDTPATTGADDGVLGHGLRLQSPWPNPRSGGGETSFSFQLPATTEVTVELYDIRGVRVDRREPERFAAGRNTVRWNPAVGAPGLYFARIVTGSGISAAVGWVVLK